MMEDNPESEIEKLHQRYVEWGALSDEELSQMSDKEREAFERDRRLYEAVQSLAKRLASVIPPGEDPIDKVVDMILNPGKYPRQKSGPEDFE